MKESVILGDNSLVPERSVPRSAYEDRPKCFLKSASDNRAPSSVKGTDLDLLFGFLNRKGAKVRQELREGFYWAILAYRHMWENTLTPISGRRNMGILFPSKNTRHLSILSFSPIREKKTGFLRFS